MKALFVLLERCHAIEELTGGIVVTIGLLAYSALIYSRQCKVRFIWREERPFIGDMRTKWPLTVGLPLENEVHGFTEFGAVKVAERLFICEEDRYKAC